MNQSAGRLGETGGDTVGGHLPVGSCWGAPVALRSRSLNVPSSLSGIVGEERPPTGKATDSLLLASTKRDQS